MTMQPMTAQNPPLAQITASAIRLLCREMGLVNTARFLMQFSTGDGDYMHERAALFAHLTVADIATLVREGRERA